MGGLLPPRQSRRAFEKPEVYPRRFRKGSLSGLSAFGVVLLGSYRCVLSFDETPPAPYPWATICSQVICQPTSSNYLPAYRPDLNPC